MSEFRIPLTSGIGVGRKPHQNCLYTIHTCTEYKKNIYFKNEFSPLAFAKS